MTIVYQDSPFGDTTGMVVYPRTYFGDVSGKALDSGALYIGLPNQDPETNPLQCYWDAQLSIPATQPLAITSGYVTNNGARAAVYVPAQNYSLRVRDRSGVLVDYIAEGGIPSPSVASRTAIKALSVTALQTVYLTEAGREGTFILKAGLCPYDPLEGIYVASNTAGWYWARVWKAPLYPPEFWGAVANNPAIDSYAAIMACVTLTGTVEFGKGSYYSSRGFIAPEYSVWRGQGVLHTGITVNHASDHLLSQSGTFPGTYAGGANIQGFGIGRGVAPTVPASPGDDATTSHGLHFSMVSNPIVKDVYTYNNLAEVYCANVLSIDFDTIRGIGQTNNARWSGLWIDGVTAIGSFGGPSGTPSARLCKINMAAASGCAQAYNYYLAGSIQDLWLVDIDAGGGHKQVFVDCNGATCGDVHIVRPICDSYKTNGIHVKGTPQGSSLFIDAPWVAGTVGATGDGIRLEASHGVTIRDGRGAGTLAPSVYMLNATDGTGINATIRATDYTSCVSLTSITASDISVDAFKAVAGSGFTGSIVTAVSGSRNRITVKGTRTAIGWASGIALDSSAAGYLLDAAGIAPSAVNDRIIINASAIGTQGNVSGHVIINPGSGAML